jgi:hypothetical protein
MCPFEAWGGGYVYWIDLWGMADLNHIHLYTKRIKFVFGSNNRRFTVSSRRMLKARRVCRHTGLCFVTERSCTAVLVRLSFDWLHVKLDRGV